MNDERYLSRSRRCHVFSNYFGCGGQRRRSTFEAMTSKFGNILELIELPRV
jgi:hypothetical protein